MNAIKNCPVTTEDVNNAKKIFGTNMLSLRCKLTRRKSTPVREDGIEIPEELILQNCKIDLCIDILYVNKCGFMTTIDQTIQFRSAIENRTHEEYYRVLDMVLGLYNSAGFHIKTIHCDREFRAMMDKVKDDLGVRMNFTNALDHVPEAERNNRTIKERVWAAYHKLPYKALLQQLIRYLVQTQASQYFYSQPKEEYHHTTAQEPSSNYPHWIMSNIAWYHLGHTCRPTMKQIKQIRTHPERSTQSTSDR
jgi:hypothetical protein